MRAKMYFKRAYLADEKIVVGIREAEKLRRAIRLLENHKGSPLGVRLAVVLEKLRVLEDEVSGEIDALIDQRAEMRRVIETVPSRRSRLVLRMRYILGMTWDDIAGSLQSDVETVLYWHGEGLRHVKLPVVFWKV